MNIEILKESGIDYEEGLKRFSGNSSMYEKYLKKLLTNDSYKKMCDAANSGNIKEAFEIAHNLKSFIGNLGIRDIYKKICALTDEFRAGICRNYAPDFHSMDRDYERILLVIKEQTDM